MPYPHGLFSWTDVSQPDPAGGSKFYADLFGLAAEDQHDPDGNHIYTMLLKDGKAAAGLAPQMSPDQPVAWTSYVTVADLDATLRAWAAAGGSVIMPAMDVMTAGRMAVAADPEGAAVALWEAGESVGGEVFGEHGTLAWNELYTRDSAAARAFYGEVLGWGFEPFEAADGEYWVATVDAKETGQAYSDDKFNGGIMTVGEGFPPDMPPHWMVYFHVDDTDEITARHQSLGGTVAMPPFDSPAGRIAVLTDPQGATFSVIGPPAG